MLFYLVAVILLFYVLTYWLADIGLILAAVTSQHLKDGDLVILTLRRPTGNAHGLSDAVAKSLPWKKRVFGFIKQTQRYSLRSSEQLHPLISELDIKSILYLRLHSHVLLN